jgi:hypothetical protein
LRGSAAVARGSRDRRFGRKLDDFGLIGGFTHQATNILHAGGTRVFTFTISGVKSLRGALNT